MTETKVVALTGGTGFIGSTVLKYLLAAGHIVRLLVRDPRKFDSLPSQLHVVPGNLQDRRSLETLVKNTEVIVHCAGRVRGSTQEEFNLDNVLGTRALLDTAIRHTHLQHFIHISSLAAREPHLSLYAGSKKLSEDVLRDHQFQFWTIIRPPAVYGPKDKELRLLFNWMRRGMMWVPGDITNRFSLLHSEDLGQLIAHQILESPPTTRIFEPDDGKNHGYQWIDLQKTASDLYGHRVRCLTIPPSILHSAAHVNVIFCKIFNNAPMLTPGKVRELLHKNWVSDPTKAVPSWKPTIDFSVGLRTL